jgi:gamma-glutamylaminecyclotransferase
MPTPLFVYGTLKRGLAGNQLLAEQQFVQEARTLPCYRLYDAGAYPCLVEDPVEGVAVEGEVWRVNPATLAQLDVFEGVPQLFVRRQIALAEVSGPVFAYFFQGDLSTFEDCGCRWPSILLGDSHLSS